VATVHAEESALIDAPPEQIYAILSDYRSAHPQILPKQHFGPLEVESGGQGAGTVFRCSVRVLGKELPFRMQVSEPEPNRVLAETDLETGLVTTFSVTPAADGRRTQLRIASRWESRSGLAGLLERLTSPAVMRRIYRSELRQIAEYVAGQPR
jgi:hypothetical protein